MVYLQISARTQLYDDDSKITDHYAIIPTGQLTELGSLSDLQKRVYDLVVRRFLSIFYPAAEYETIKLVVQVGAEQLFASAKVLKNPGFLEIMGRPGPMMKIRKKKVQRSITKTGRAVKDR